MKTSFLRYGLMLAVCAALQLCNTLPAGAAGITESQTAASKEKTSKPVGTVKAVFAGGCFWCMDAAFQDLPGVQQVVSGYTGGHVANPTYQQVSTGKTGHVEAIEVTYDPARVSYPTLLKHFWENVDPTDPDGQFCDKGSQYGAGIFYTTSEQEQQARESLKPIQSRFSQPVATFIRKAEPFYPAEAYHQSYAQKNALRYKLYETGCGRAERLGTLNGR